MTGMEEIDPWYSNSSSHKSNDHAGLLPTARFQHHLNSSLASSQPSTSTLATHSLAADKTSNTMMNSMWSLADNGNDSYRTNVNIQKQQWQQQQQQQQQPRVFATTLENHNPPVSKLERSGDNNEKIEAKYQAAGNVHNKSSSGEGKEEETSLEAVAGNNAASPTTTATLTQAERAFKRHKSSIDCRPRLADNNTKESSLVAVAIGSKDHHVVDEQDSDHWDEYYYQLAFFKATEGHASVPENYVCKDDYCGKKDMEFELGKWVALQRTQLSSYLRVEKDNEHEQVSEHIKLRIQKLQKIGFEFDDADAWDTYNFGLVIFQAIHGHTNVPLDYVSNHQQLQLGKWVAQQRNELSALLQAGKKK